MMAVKARFYVAAVTRRASSGSDGVTDVMLQPVVRGDEGKAWARWTPSGKIELTSLSEGASAWFGAHLGKDVMITFDDPADVSSGTPVADRTGE